MSIHRSQTLARAAATAFDFDVVSDVPAPPSRKPDAREQPAPRGGKAAPDTAEIAKA